MEILQPFYLFKETLFKLFCIPVSASFPTPVPKQPKNLSLGNVLFFVASAGCEGILMLGSAGTVVGLAMSCPKSSLLRLQNQLNCKFIGSPGSTSGSVLSDASISTTPKMITI